MEVVRTGFASYLKAGEFTPDFISDVDGMITKVYRRWSLYEGVDEFSAFCWTKLVKSLRIYDEQGGRERGPLSTYLYQVIMNEARRLYSKHRKMAVDDIDEMPNPTYWGYQPGVYNASADLDLRDRLCDFARMAYGLGVHVDQEKVYRNYYLGCNTPAVKAFMWLSVLSRAVD